MLLLERRRPAAVMVVIVCFRLWTGAMCGAVRWRVRRVVVERAVNVMSRC
jgi:ABC-type uncharacterized transport system permease subunit